MQRTSLKALVLALALSGCSQDAGDKRESIDNSRTPPGGEGDASASRGENPGGDSNGASNAGATGGATAGGGPMGSGSAGGTSGDGAPGPTPGPGSMPKPPPLRFAVLGDGGTGDGAQAKVAAALKTVCAARGCAFALYLGDNIYEDGANGVTDAQFKAKFEDPYAEVDFPFYVVLGNHDYGSNGTNLLPSDAKSAAQVEYTGRSEKWNMPSYYYTFREGPVAFFALDTNGIVLDRFRKANEQQNWLEEQLQKSDAPWKIVFGHHPYVSNGEHGNAGSYMGPVGIELNDGTKLKNLVEETVCGQVNVYFSGHDHDREWLKPTCGTTFIVSGAAAKLRRLENRGTPSLFGDGSKRGFLWVEIDGDLLSGVFYDEDGKVSYEGTVARK